MLPGLDGWAVTQEARREGIATPIMIVSARGSEHDKVHTLGIGADDYLAKPFGMRELVARVQALLRRSAPRRTSGGRSTDRRARASRSTPPAPRLPARGRGRVRRRRADADRVPAAAHAGAPAGPRADRDELQQRVWDVPYRARDRTVDVCVRKLREKLDRRSTHSYLHTQYGVGYRFDPIPRPPSDRYPRGMATVSTAPLPHRGRRGRAHARARPPGAPQRALPCAPERSIAALAETAADTSLHAVDRARRGARVLRRARPSRRWRAARCRARASLFETCSEMMMAIHRLPQPVIARVHGLATAAGCQLVAACDLAIAGEDARFATLRRRSASSARRRWSKCPARSDASARSRCCSPAT